ncbi:MAG: DUF4012 domain-containing protein [Patescibacteria group bacterium]|nr:DUF4012 domain-containing protein [Patescibacteria group bacterium]MCL5262005.1 DUF4012 domain-containing protein [Patescibacteria group bacterium]
MSDNKPLKKTSVVKDIKNPGGEFEEKTFNGLFRGRGDDSFGPKTNRFSSKAVVFGAAIVIAGLAFGMFIHYRNQTMRSVAELQQSFMRIVSFIDRSDISGDNAGSGVEPLDWTPGDSSILQAFDFWSEGGRFPEYLIAFNKDIDAAESEMASLKQSGLNWLFEDGEALVASLERLEKTVSSINDKAALLRNVASKFGFAGKISPAYLNLQSGLYTIKDGLAGLQEVLAGNSHIAFIFENVSEIRPAGGFNGSYADAAVKFGKIETLTVNDIFYPDQYFEENVVPPKPLQVIAKSWGARDANWFFDFPSSAEKTLSFLNGSSAYKDKAVEFQGVVAINSRAVERILDICGPIDLPEYKLTLTKDNFLTEIQEEVSLNSASKGPARKQILKVLAPKIVERIQQSDDTQKERLFASIFESFNRKDIRVYFKNRRLETAAESLGMTGSIYKSADGDYADYLAVANANINGGKTDVFMKQKISLKSELLSDGTIKNNLEIVRTHTGQNQKLSFYRATNQDYIQILAPKEAKALKATGNTSRTVTPKVNYAKAGYSRDPDVELFESGFQSAKKVLGYWLDVRPGKTGKLAVSYEQPSMIRDHFRFVYEKQSGVESSFKYEISAPPGFIFKETGISAFSYESDDPPKRLIIDLNLKQI